MKKEFKTFEFKVSTAEANGDIGYIEGYASTFGNIDLGDDVVDKGAFNKTIKDKKGVFPILLDHMPTKQIGWNLEASEDDYGLHVKGEIQLITEEAKNRYLLAKRAKDLGTKSGLSIGYSAVKAEPDKNQKQVRRLKELKLYEYSLVTFPMNEMASITQAKAVEAFFDRVQKQGYDVNELFEALEKLGVKSKQTQAASSEIDPNVLQSMDKLIKTLKPRQ